VIAWGVVAQVRDDVPGLVVERLRKRRESDDDNVFFLGVGSELALVQVDCSPDGAFPLLIEDAGGRVQASTATEAPSAVLRGLGRPDRGDAPNPPVTPRG
jgi:hypothetical protein